MLRMVNHLDQDDLLSDVEVTIYRSGGQLVVAVQSSGLCVARVRLPVGSSGCELVGQVTAEVAAIYPAGAPRPLCS